MQSARGYVLSRLACTWAGCVSC